MHILMVASEAYPYSRTGGLGDVLDSLPAALVALGLEVTVVSPWWGSLKGQPRELWRGTQVRGGRMVPGEVVLGEIAVAGSGLRQLFLRTPGFEVPGLYSEHDVERFCHWGRELLPALASAGLSFDVLHGHDWGAGLPVAHARLLGLPTVFSVHNLQYQGRWNLREAAPWTGLSQDALSGAEFYGDLNLMKAGLTYAHHVTTVSPTYAREIATPEYGEGLDGVTRERLAHGELSGILNGLDLDRWDPATDPDILPMRGPGDKARNRAALRAEFELDDAPVVVAVSRLAEQKGLDLLLEALPEVKRDWNVVVLGSGDRLLETALRGWSQHPRVRFVPGMNEPLAHRLYAGGDVFAMPSRFEPCGLSQMIAMRYGTLPVVRLTGGLVDSVPPEVGFRFEDATPAALTLALHGARAVYDRPAEWAARVALGQTLDFSWTASARRYAGLYAAVAQHAAHPAGAGA